jgi:hypothetical protein
LDVALWPSKNCTRQEAKLTDWPPFQ